MRKNFLLVIIDNVLKGGINLKIGIFTIIDYSNYGNRLQNYASQQVLKKYCNDVVTIVPQSMKIKKTKIIKKVYRLIRCTMDKEYKNRLKKTNNFINFTYKYINNGYYDISQTISNEINTEFDKVFVGSDQVWNTDFNVFSVLFFLPFVESKKRYCISPSFGKNNIEDEYKTIFKENLTSFSELNVREEAGQKIIENLLNKKVKILLDPTLLLTKTEWEDIASSRFTPNNKYVLTYFLGSRPTHLERILNQFKSEYKIINLDDSALENEFCAGPDDFIDLIRNASCVLTNSFHASVFSLIFNSSFVVFDRNDNYKSMSSRLDTFLSTFELTNRRYCEDIDYFSCDFEKANVTLDVLRKESLDYLCRCVGV